ncbi:hypothetical protein [Mesorhizobium sp. B2-6-3]|uniref:hypothetical protein n=1 Tax=Mesorhizobium sp. B2-6-3 TaxID=2589914 RepID=UPI001FF01EFC|nr:hypothetical protein [Mesorhizobium sp. B2-6-3]
MGLLGLGYTTGELRRAVGDLGCIPSIKDFGSRRGGRQLLRCILDHAGQLADDGLGDDFLRGQLSGEKRALRLDLVRGDELTREAHAACSGAEAAETSAVCAKSLAVTWPPVARSIAATESQDGLDMPRLIRLICDWDMPTVTANASSVISWSEMYWASFMPAKMHAMHMHVKHDYACHAILSKRAGE